VKTALVLRRYRTVRAVALRCGVTTQAVYKWGAVVPKKHWGKLKGARR
jgi:hypothetical protein